MQLVLLELTFSRMPQEHSSITVHRSYASVSEWKGWRQKRAGNGQSSVWALCKT